MVTRVELLFCNGQSGLYFSFFPTLTTAAVARWCPGLQQRPFLAAISRHSGGNTSHPGGSLRQRAESGSHGAAAVEGEGPVCGCYTSGEGTVHQQRTESLVLGNLPNEHSSTGLCRYWTTNCRCERDLTLYFFLSQQPFLDSFFIADV